MKRRGRPVLGVFSGFFAGLFGAVTLLAFGVVPLDSILVTALPVVLGIAVGAIAMWSPFRRSDGP